MDLLDVMLKRRSVRKYRKDEIPNEKLNKILQAGLLAPTSRNRKPCSFLVVDNKEALEKLSESKESSSKFLKNANKAIVVVANSLISDTWIEDSSIALTYMHLMAAEQKVGSCWVQIHMRRSKDGNDAEENVRKIMNVPDNYRVVGILSLGMPAENCKPHDFEHLDYRKIHYVE